ncbi:MAG TPA: thioredoxin family protein [Clostridia bacterium]|nr:thioredoxin family protein [Clostridia bacterium]
MKARTIALFLLVFGCSALFAQGAPANSSTDNQATNAASSAMYAPVHVYDAARDAASDIDSAVKEAARTGKRVLVEVGGLWCSWCKYMDKFFDQNTNVRQLRDDNFVLVKVNFSPENENKTVLAKYGNVPGYPHIFVLDSDGKLLHSQETANLEEGRGYSAKAVTTFLNKWAPARAS